MEQQRSTEKCKICGSNAIGMRYGVYACGSCKKFFQRNNSRNLDSMRCELGKRLKQPCDMLKRRSCAKCRLEKCLSVGMKIASKQGPKLEPNGDGAASGVTESTKASLRRYIAEKQQAEIFMDLSTSSSSEGSSTTVSLPLHPVDFNSLKHEIVLRQIMYAATDASKVGFQGAVGVAGYLCKEGIPTTAQDFFKMLSWSIDRSVRAYLPFALQIPGINRITSLLDRCCLIDNAYVLSFFTQWPQYKNTKEDVFAMDGRYFAEFLKIWPELAEATKHNAQMAAALQEMKPTFTEFLMHLAFILCNALPECRITDPETSNVLKELYEDVTITAKAYFYQKSQDPEVVERKMAQLMKMADVSMAQRDGRHWAMASLYRRRPELAAAMIQPVADVVCEQFFQQPMLTFNSSSPLPSPTYSAPASHFNGSDCNVYYNSPSTSSLTPFGQSAMSSESSYLVTPYRGGYQSSQQFSNICQPPSKTLAVDVLANFLNTAVCI